MDLSKRHTLPWHLASSIKNVRSEEGGEQCSSLKRIDSCRGRGDLPARVDTPTIFFLRRIVTK